MNTLIQLIESVKQSFSTTVDSFIDFINKRSKGAAKIAESTEKKGGLSLLTTAHFKAKATPYSKGLKWSKKPNVAELLEAEYKVNLDKLQNLDNLTQTQFQQLTGKLEVYGELYIKHKN
jgi:phage-related protein